MDLRLVAESEDDTLDVLAAQGALAQRIQAKITAAINYRAASGIERQWIEDEEFTEGIDDLNRGDSIRDWVKPRDGSGGLTRNQQPADQNRCTEFFNITGPAVDAAEARVGDILLPANDWNFSISPTPIPEFEAHLEDEQPVTLPDGQQQSLGQVIQERDERVFETVRRAETRIKDWLVDCGYKQEMRRAIRDAAEVGTGIMKGPYPEKRTTKVIRDGVLVIEEKIYPACTCVDYWDIFPDPMCGTDMTKGSYIVERVWQSREELLALDASLGYIPEAIRSAVSKADAATATISDMTVKDKFEVWHYYGKVPVRDFLPVASGLEADQLEDEYVSAVVCMVNGLIIKAYVDPLNNGELPFSVIIWKAKRKSPWGIGVARQGRTAQKMALAATRALMDNAGLAAVPMMAVMRDALTPADGNWSISSGKVWYINSSTGVTNAQQAIQPVITPMLQNELAAVLDQARRMMEDATGVVSLLQGQLGSAPDTLGGMQMLNNNATALLRRIARNTDVSTTQLISRFYDWLLLYGEDDEKADVTIEALGSTALVEREIQSMQLPQILQLSLDPRYEKSPKKVFDQILLAYHFDPQQFSMTPEEREELQQMMEAQAQQQAPQVQAAQIRAEAELAKEQLRTEASVQKMQLDTDRDTVHVSEQARRTEIMAAAKDKELALRQELALLEYQTRLLDYANKKDMKLEDVKAKLAEVTLKLNLQRELATQADARPAPQIAEPVAEPPGRARDGFAFQE